MPVRPAVPGDAVAIGAVNLAVWRETYAELVDAAILDTFTETALADRWRSHLAADGAGYTIVVAEHDDRVVGYAASGPPRDVDPPTPLELYSIYLLSESKGRGLGRALLDATVGERPAHLWVASANTSAQAFYTRTGFTLDDSAEKPIDEFGGLLSRRMVR